MHAFFNVTTAQANAGPLAAWLLAALSLGLAASSAQAARIKEVAAVEGVRSNQLTGFGLVVGLDGTSDQSLSLTNQGMSNYRNSWA